MSKVLTIDVGTTACKVVVFDTQGNIHAVANNEYKTYSPKLEWAEQDPNDWYKSCLDGIRECLSKVDGSDIVAIGLSSQRETIVPVDISGDVLYRAVLWMDRRTKKEAQEISFVFGKDNVHKITGLIPDSTFSATKLLWFKKNNPEVIKKAAVFLQPKEYIGFKLTGVCATDYSLASRTMMFDINKKTWWDDIFDYIGIKKDQFPPIFHSDEVFGYLKEDVAKHIGLKSGIPVVVGGGDRPLEAIGAGIIGDRVMESTGTATNVSITSKKVPERLDKRVVCSCHAIRDHYLIEQGISTSGTILRWLRDNFYKKEQDSVQNIYEIIDSEVEASSPGANNLLLLPFFMGARATRWNPDAKGVLFGLTLSHTRADIARSVLEGISYEIRACIDVIECMGFSIKSIVSMGGGAKSPVWSRIKSDITGKEIIVERVSEAASKGAMLLALYGIGAKDELIEEKREIEKRYYPDEKNRARYDKLYRVYNHLYDSLVEIYSEISNI